MIVFGTRLFGRVDVVPGLFHVATQFFHIWYCPLVPTKSWVVFAGSEHGSEWRGVPIAMSGKSVLTAYFRAALIVATVFCVVRSIATFAKDPTTAVFSGLLGAAAVVMAVFSWRARASKDRAREIAAMIDLDPVVVDEVFGAGGETTPA